MKTTLLLLPLLVTRSGLLRSRAHRCSGFSVPQPPDEAYDMERVGYYRCKRAWPMERNGAIAGIPTRGIRPILAKGAPFPPIGTPWNSSAPCRDSPRKPFRKTPETGRIPEEGKLPREGVKHKSARLCGGKPPKKITGNSPVCTRRERVPQRSWGAGGESTPDFQPRANRPKLPGEER